MPPSSPCDALQAVLGRTPGAALLLVAIVGIGCITLFLTPAAIGRGALRPYWLVRERQWMTLLSNAFLHADLPHLAFNAFTFWAFGFALERTIGTPRFLALYAVGLLVSDFGTWWRHRREPDYRTLGASGAIMAVLFASIVHTPTSAIYILPVPVPIPAPLFAVGYLAYTAYAARRRVGGVNHDAHLSGALAGLAFVAVTDPTAVLRALRRLTS